MIRLNVRYADRNVALGPRPERGGQVERAGPTGRTGVAGHRTGPARRPTRAPNPARLEIARAAPGVRPATAEPAERGTAPHPAEREQRGTDRVRATLHHGTRRGAVLVEHLQSRLPANPVPLYLGLGALAATGALSWPFALAAGCSYAAFRHWEPQPSGMPCQRLRSSRR